MQAPAAATAKNLSHLLPSELIDKCIGSQIWVRGAAPPRPLPRKKNRKHELRSNSNSAILRCAIFQSTRNDHAHVREHGLGRGRAAVALDAVL